jgi:hypothetical protein
MELFTLEHLPKEIELETKMQYSLPGENKDGGISLEHLPEETEIETKMQYFLPGENKDGGIY